MKPKVKHPKLDPNKNAELKLLAERVGQFIEYWGFKAVQGRLWCYLYLSQEPLNSRQLAQLLGISPALVTQSVQVLLEYKVILEAEKGVNGVLCFKANPNVAEAIHGVISKREAVLLEKVAQAHGALSKAKKKPVTDSDVQLSSDRVRQLGQWVSLAQAALEMGILSLSDTQNPFSEPEAFQIALTRH